MAGEAEAKFDKGNDPNGFKSRKQAKIESLAESSLDYAGIRAAIDDFLYHEVCDNSITPDEANVLYWEMMAGVSVERAIGDVQ